MSLTRTLLGCVAALCIAMPVFAAEEANNQQPPQPTELAANQPQQVATTANVMEKQKAGEAQKEEKTVNINTATTDELTTVKGIGKKRAQAIVAYRDQHGPFKSVDDLAAVKGVSKRFVEKNRNYLTIG